MSYPHCRKNLMATLTIRLDDKPDRELARLARRQKRTKSDLAREMLRRRLLVERFEEARRRIVPHAERAGHPTDEDVFHDVS
jgi:predicted transcriptional regulator